MTSEAYFFLNQWLMAIKNFFFRRMGDCHWQERNFLAIGCRKQENHPEGLSCPSSHLSLRVVVGCPAHCCHLSLGTSISCLNSSVISVRCGVIASVCSWAAWSNYLNSPSGLVPKGKALTTAVEVLTIHCQSMYGIIHVLLQRA